MVPVRRFRRKAFAALFLALALALPAAAGATDPAPVRPPGAVLVPDHFLRSWDPVTLFFDADAGPAAGGPEDDPGRVVKMTPAHPGVFTWLNARTLQFRPAVPWPPMGRFDFVLGDRRAELVTLMAGAERSLPANGSEGLDPVAAVTLVFADPIAPDTLAEIATIDLAPLPGIGDRDRRTLDRRDFEVKVMERSRPSDPAAYVLNLHDPIPWGMRATVRLRLVPGAASPEEQRISFSTAAPFHVERFGCRNASFPATPEGVSYARERALVCPPSDRAIVIHFSERPQPPTPIEARNLVRLSPQVEDLRFDTYNKTLVVRGRFASDTLYQVRLEPAALKDGKDRPLAMKAASELFLSFPAQPGFVRWKAGDGIAERFGPQMVPVKARGVERVDLRVHPIAAENRSLWPFPEEGIGLDETRRPPGPGEEPAPWTEAASISPDRIARHIAAFGSPSLSELVPLAADKGSTASFGLNLRPLLARVFGEGKPGHYLVGLRNPEAKGERSWMRLQVTDLSLTAVEETDRVRFAVTSLATGKPVAGATIRLEGPSEGRNWVTIGDLTTGDDGLVSWTVPGASRQSIARILVAKDDDRLVLDPRRPPRIYAEGGWRDREYYDWLGWTTEGLQERQIPPVDLCHLFTERPIYRPDDAVHIKGYIRRWRDGRLAISDRSASLVVRGPDESEWRYPVTLNEFGSFYHKFDARTEATGEYRATLEFAHESDEEGACHLARFKKEAYRLPRFEVQLHGPQTTNLDAPFKVPLTTEYYAGGVVIDRPVRWHITQVPFNWVPKARPGFVFSADSRFSGHVPFQASPVLDREGKTDAQGAAAITLDPTIEPTAQPRKYLVEATVVGDDDQTVTNSQEILALPPFVLGLKVGRFLERAKSVDPEIVVEDAQGKPLEGQKVTVRLVRRQWNSTLQATDFTHGGAKYVTETVDEKVAETSFVSGTEAHRASFPIEGAGVFLVEVESQDRMGRLQTVKVDLFAGGERPATWSRPPAEVFSTNTDKTAYAPGETAKILLQSPFQTAQALAIVEEPDGHNSYAWVPVEKGYGTFELPIKPEYLPRVPVHFVLMRGRLKGNDDEVSGHIDLRKPGALAASQWVTVTPRENLAKVDLAYPRKARPGEEVEIAVRLADADGKPLAGEVTLWLVDQAVLALAREARLDPLPDFVVKRQSRMELRDTRNLAFGLLPLFEEPGGDEGDDGSPLQRVTVRKNFTPVPYYEPSLRIGPDGLARVRVTLPDSLTNFKLRAKAVSGPTRFGYGTGEIQVRLPVLVQPALPRFVRPGDRFELAAIGRMVDGAPGSDGSAEVRVKGMELTGGDLRQFKWQANVPERLAFPVKVPAGAAGEVEVTLGVQRDSDGAKDAFQVALPVLPDRDPLVARLTAPLTAAGPVVLPAVTEPIRPGSLERRVLVADKGLAALAGGLDYLRAYPFGCTEQRISQARANIASLRFGDALAGPETGSERLARTVETTQKWVASSLDGNGLVAYWPGGRGYVPVTAWALQFLVEADAAGLKVDKALAEKLATALRQALRSDYRNFIDADSWGERTWALAALTAAGKGDPAYAAELARKSQFMGAESIAQITRVLALSDSTPKTTREEMQKRLWQELIFKLDQGKEVYGGLQERGRPAPVILPSETRALAQVLRASATNRPDEPRNRLLADTLVALGKGDGWGSTNANAEAILALSDWIAATPAPGADIPLAVTFGTQRRDLILPRATPMVRIDEPSAEAIAIAPAGPLSEPLAVWSRTAYVPQADGSTVAAAANGLVVEREQWRVPADGGAPARLPLDAPAAQASLPVGEVLEDHLVLVNQVDRVHVAVTLPLAAGMEPLNPALATAPPEAKPSRPLTQAPTYVAFLDDRLMWFYDQLPKGTYHFYARSRATVPGRYIQPAASARAMYDDTVGGNGNGAVMEVVRP